MTQAQIPVRYLFRMIALILIGYRFHYSIELRRLGDPLRVETDFGKAAFANWSAGSLAWQ